MRVSVDAFLEEIIEGIHLLITSLRSRAAEDMPTPHLHE